MNCLIVLMVVCGGFKLICGEELKCDFTNVKHSDVGNLYTCFVTSLINLNKTMTIKSSTGIHERNKNNNDVKGIYIHDTNTKFIPENLGSVFNLTSFAMAKTQLIEIKSTNFQQMQDLELLSLYGNNLTVIPTDVFSTLMKLRIIGLGSNQIEEIPQRLFDNNFNLEVILLWDNKIIIVASGIFDNLKKLSVVYFERNVCINKRYNGTREIIQLKNDLSTNCMNPNEVQATTTTKQNTLEEQGIEMEEKNNILVSTNGWTSMEKTFLVIIILLIILVIMMLLVYFWRLKKINNKNNVGTEIQELTIVKAPEDQLQKEQQKKTTEGDVEQLLDCMIDFD